MSKSTDSKISHRGLTFDDVLVLPQYSEVLPRDTNTKTKLTKGLEINIPIVSAAMDTVTEARLAIAISREGGIGIIHKNMSIEDQAMQVKKVKRSESGMIKDPITLSKSNTLSDALGVMKENRIGGIPITDDTNTLIGIITNRDLRFQRDLNTLIGDVMTTESLITAASGTDLKEAEQILQKYKIEKLPVVDADQKLLGLITFKDIQKVKNHPQACKDSFGRLMVGAAVGVTADTMERVTALVEQDVDVVAIDTAHGHSKGVVKELKKVKSKFPNLQVIVGNVATAEAAKYLADNGADAVKVGVGPGSICTTRIIAGIGAPQLSAIMECSKALEGTGVPVIADGGIRYSGDLVKAIVAGADTIMAGSLFAGTEEAPGEVSFYDGRKVKSYRGMGSIEAMKKGSTDRYFQDAEAEIGKLVPEGIVGTVAYKGSLSEVVYQYIGGLRAGMGYTGSSCIVDLKNARFTHITGSGIRESHPHDITITKEAPNYSR
ncbi:MAG: IMP dehydrogenase [Bacteroidia bacterium]|nr:IMP dehydrogenase [Bacteroidia bacterium]|tara:strand:- start:10118 stop:11590 length:1473 start_codon:yes stop_codon:yes gene_type:complete